jgi:mRNA-degrading endonuclease RelE of RelBE toxin-antitoxin system
MPGAFRVVSTPSFEREFRKISTRNAALLSALEELITALSQDPHNKSGQHAIKKLAGLKPGEGQWRIRWREYRLRYDIFGVEVVLHSFRHRKEAYD